MSRFHLPAVAFSSTVVLSIALPIGGRLFAQDVLLNVKSPVPGAIADVGIAIGDWDGDGVGDLAIGAPGDDTVASDAGAARVHSGANGGILATFYGTNAGDYFGSALARLPDLDGDGLDDLAVAAIGASVSGTGLGSVFLYSGRSGALLRRIDNPSPGGAFGQLVGPMGDVDGDSIPDLYVSESGAGEVHVQSGADGHEITKITGSASEEFGSGVSAVDDLDGDGVRDLLIGAKWYIDSTGNQVGAAWVYSTATGAVLRKYKGTHGGEYLGYDTAALADLDGDGVNEYAISAKWNPVTLSGTVLVISGATDTQLAALIAPVQPWDWLLTEVVAAGDVNGDGVGDIAVEGLWADENLFAHAAAYLFSGKTFLVLDRIERPDLSVVLAPFGDLNGDGLDDLLVGSFDYSYDGEVSVYSGDDLWLNVTPSQAFAGEHLQFNTREGVTGALTALVLEAVDSVPTFAIVGGVRTFGALGGNKQFLTIPSGLAGHDFTFRAYADDASGKVIASATQVLSCK